MYRHFIIGIVCFLALSEPSAIEHFIKNQRYEKCYEKRADSFRLTSFFSYLCTFKDLNNKI